MGFPANAGRAVSADTALAAYMTRTSCDCEECLAALLRDLMHWADMSRLSFADALRIASFDYAVQVTTREATP